MRKLPMFMLAVVSSGVLADVSDIDVKRVSTRDLILGLKGSTAQDQADVLTAISDGVEETKDAVTPKSIKENQEALKTAEMYRRIMENVNLGMEKIRDPKQLARMVQQASSDAEFSTKMTDFEKAVKEKKAYDFEMPVRVAQNSPVEMRLNFSTNDKGEAKIEPSFKITNNVSKKALSAWNGDFKAMDDTASQLTAPFTKGLATQITLDKDKDFSQSVGSAMEIIGDKITKGDKENSSVKESMKDSEASLDPAKDGSDANDVKRKVDLAKNGGAEVLKDLLAKRKIVEYLQKFPKDSALEPCDLVKKALVPSEIPASTQQECAPELPDSSKNVTKKAEDEKKAEELGKKERVMDDARNTAGANKLADLDASCNSLYQNRAAQVGSAPAFDAVKDVYEGLAKAGAVSTLFWKLRNDPQTLALMQLSGNNPMVAQNDVSSVQRDIRALSNDDLERELKGVGAYVSYLGSKLAGLAAMSPGGFQGLQYAAQMDQRIQDLLSMQQLASALHSSLSQEKYYRQGAVNNRLQPLGYGSSMGVPVVGGMNQMGAGRPADRAQILNSPNPGMRPADRARDLNTGTWGGPAAVPAPAARRPDVLR